MFLLPNQQLERCDRVMQQRVKPHIHTTLAAEGDDMSVVGSRN